MRKYADIVDMPREVTLTWKDGAYYVSEPDFLQEGESVRLAVLPAPPEDWKPIVAASILGQVKTRPEYDRDYVGQCAMCGHDPCQCRFGPYRPVVTVSLETYRRQNERRRHLENERQDWQRMTGVKDPII